MKKQIVLKKHDYIKIKDIKPVMKTQLYNAPHYIAIGEKKQVYELAPYWNQYCDNNAHKNIIGVRIRSDRRFPELLGCAQVFYVPVWRYNKNDEQDSRIDNRYIAADYDK